METTLLLFPYYKHGEEIWLQLAELGLWRAGPVLSVPAAISSLHLLFQMQGTQAEVTSFSQATETPRDTQLGGLPKKGDGQPTSQGTVHLHLCAWMPRTSFISSSRTSLKVPTSFDSLPSTSLPHFIFAIVLRDKSDYFLRWWFLAFFIAFEGKGGCSHV